MRIILYLLLGSGLCAAITPNETYSATFKDSSEYNCTFYDRSFEKVLSRNKRWFVFPKGGSALITMVVTKPILGGMPRGLQESIEVEMGFSLPPLVEGWRPVPLLQNQVKSALNTTPVAQPKIDIGFVNNIWDKHQWRDYSHNRRTHGKPLRNHRKNYINSALPSFHRYPTVLFKQPLLYKRQKKPNVHPSHYHREYRERRQIFEKFEGLGKFLGINIKSCIMRAICEVKNTLLPEGNSFIEDVARIVFTIPIDQAFDDDYTDSASTVNEQINCAKKFSVTCPFSPMAYFVKNGPQAPAKWNKRDISRQFNL